MSRLGTEGLLSLKTRKKGCAFGVSNAFLSQHTSLLPTIPAMARLGFGALFEPIALAKFEPKGKKDVFWPHDSTNRICLDRIWDKFLVR